MNIFDLILWPFKWIVSVVLWLFHTLFTSLGMDPASGMTWVLCIIFLTLVMRTLTIPLFVKQIKATARYDRDAGRYGEAAGEVQG